VRSTPVSLYPRRDQGRCLQPVSSLHVISASVIMVDGCERPQIVRGSVHGRMAGKTISGKQKLKLTQSPSSSLRQTEDLTRKIICVRW
jgi:hypothetical protein